MVELKAGNQEMFRRLLTWFGQSIQGHPGTRYESSLSNTVIRLPFVVELEIVYGAIVRNLFLFWKFNYFKLLH